MAICLNKNLENKATLCFDVGLGGTEILKPLNKIFKTAPFSGFSRHLFVLTDGEVDNTEQVIDLVRKNTSNFRVFSFGIGDSCSRSLVNRIALAGNGKSEFCKHGEILEDKIGRHLERALQPAVVKGSVLWEGVKNMQQVPYFLPPVFRGDRQIAYAFFEIEKTDQSQKVVLQLNDKVKNEIAFAYPFDHKDKIIGICLRYGVMSKYVSLLAIEQREGWEGKEMQLREIPVQLGATFCDNRTSVMRMPSRLYSDVESCDEELSNDATTENLYSKNHKTQVGSKSRKMAYIEAIGEASSDDELSNAVGNRYTVVHSYEAEVGGKKCETPLDDDDGDLAVDEKPQSIDAAPKPVLNQVLNLQRWNGSWEFSGNLESILGVTKNDADKQAGGNLDAAV
ncbi:LOW QUALITY PROTEIN: von Willebrand factor A domain-containing protein 5A-like [Paramacrobiotus metropolitanus]|uniref:LOW QUALITY PROTEIN: von Willebrand factor A domain-containing protein 5A-like n=1 Tax=Paramacrobiotus metropolitanus TaxID=2943436 RepID=UPI0024465515|nr:LOW QUALITY PROTEIN: von Willebrand factor A domain-containing protein 5A-like [Paramacrobiotus metropolitanus]